MMARLLDILHGNGNGSDAGFGFWNDDAPDDREPIPAGRYVVRLAAGAPHRSRTKGTPSYRLTLEVADGPHAGRLLWHHYFDTSAARRRSREALARIGITGPDQLARPPIGLALDAVVALRSDDAGRTWNEVIDLALADSAPPPGPDLSPDSDDLAPAPVPAAPTPTPAPTATNNEAGSADPAPDAPSAVDRARAIMAARKAAEPPKVDRLMRVTLDCYQELRPEIVDAGPDGFALALRAVPGHSPVRVPSCISPESQAGMVDGICAAAASTLTPEGGAL